MDFNEVHDEFFGGRRIGILKKSEDNKMISRIQNIQRTKLVKVTDTRRKQIYSKVEDSKNYLEDCDEQLLDHSSYTDDLMMHHHQNQDSLMLTLETPPRSPIYNYGQIMIKEEMLENSAGEEYENEGEESEEDVDMIMNSRVLVNNSSNNINNDENKSKILDDIIEMMSEQQNTDFLTSMDHDEHGETVRDDEIDSGNGDDEDISASNSESESDFNTTLVEEETLISSTSTPIIKIKTEPAEEAEESIIPAPPTYADYGLADFRFPSEVENFNLDSFDYLNNLSNTLEAENEENCTTTTSTTTTIEFDLNKVKKEEIVDENDEPSTESCTLHYDGLDDLNIEKESQPEIKEEPINLFNRMKDCMLNWSTPPPTNPSSPISCQSPPEEFILPDIFNQQQHQQQQADTDDYVDGLIDSDGCLIAATTAGNDGSNSVVDDFEMDEDLIKSSLELFEDMSQEIEKDLIGDLGSHEWNWNDSLDDVAAHTEIKAEPLDEADEDAKRLEFLRSVTKLDHPYCSLEEPSSSSLLDDEEEEEEDVEENDFDEDEMDEEDGNQVIKRINSKQVKIKLDKDDKFYSTAQEDKDEKNLNILLNYPSIKARIKHIGRGSLNGNSLTLLPGTSDSFQKRKILHIPLKDLMRVLEEKISPSERKAILSGEAVTINNCKDLILQTLKRGSASHATLASARNQYSSGSSNNRNFKHNSATGAGLHINLNNNKNSRSSLNNHQSNNSSVTSSTSSKRPGSSSHNNTERIRRIDLRNSFDNLRDTMPHLECKQRVSKVEILRKASEFIKSLRDIEKNHLKEQSDLKNTHKVLKDRVKEMQKELEKKPSQFVKK